MSATAASQRVRLKSIALPPEHGAWGFLLEPLLAGLIAAALEQVKATAPVPAAQSKPVPVSD